MIKIKNRIKKNYSQIPNDLIVDTTISSGALRVILYLYSKPDDWTIYNRDICRQLKISEKTLTNYWKILLSSKWLRRYKLQDKEGKFIGGGYCYEIGEFTVSDNSSESGKSSELTNTNSNKKERTNNKKEIYTSGFSNLWKFYNVGNKYKASQCYSKFLKAYKNDIDNSKKILIEILKKEKGKDNYHKHLTTILNNLTQDISGVYEEYKNIKEESTTKEWK